MTDWLIGDWLINWYACCLLASPDLWNRMLLKCSITMIFTCPLLPWCEISSPFKETNPHLHAVGQFMVHPPSRIISHPKGKKFPWPLPAYSSSEKALALGVGRILIPRFIQSPPNLAVYWVAHFLPLGGVDRDFPFIESEDWRHFSYISGTFRELYFIFI